MTQQALLVGEVESVFLGRESEHFGVDARGLSVRFDVYGLGEVEFAFQQVSEQFGAAARRLSLPFDVDGVDELDPVFLERTAWRKRSST